jgi:hypothetical protein
MTVGEARSGPAGSSAVPNIPCMVNLYGEIHLVCVFFTQNILAQGSSILFGVIDTIKKE